MSLLILNIFDEIVDNLERLEIKFQEFREARISTNQDEKILSINVFSSRSNASLIARHNKVITMMPIYIYKIYKIYL